MFGIKKELAHDNVDIHLSSIVKKEPVVIKKEVSFTEEDSSASDQLTVSNHGTSLYECPITNVKLEVIDEASFSKDEGSFGPGCSSHTAALVKCEPDIGPEELRPQVILPCTFEPDEYKPVKTEDIPREQEPVVVKVEEFQQSDKELLLQNCSEKLPQEIRGKPQRDAKLVEMSSQYVVHTDASKQSKLKTAEMLAHASGVPAPIAPVCTTHREETRCTRLISNAVKPCNNVNSKKFETKCGCEVCSSKPSLRNHLRIKKKGHSFLPSALSSQRKIFKTSSTFECHFCNKMFTQKSKYIFHMQVHPRVKLYECHSCGKMFTKRANLIVHLRVHSGEKPFECKYCDKRFSGLSNLTSHTRVHTGEKPFGCKSCGKTFSVSSSLKVHKRIHTGEKPFECKSCGKRFRDSSSISRHSRVHTGEKPYECQNCSKKFRVSSALTSHMRVHTI